MHSKKFYSIFLNTIDLFLGCELNQNTLINNSYNLINKLTSTLIAYIIYVIHKH